MISTRGLWCYTEQTLWPTQPLPCPLCVKTLANLWSSLALRWVQKELTAWVIMLCCACCNLLPAVIGLWLYLKQDLIEVVVGFLLSLCRACIRYCRKPWIKDHLLHSMPSWFQRQDLCLLITLFYLFLWVSEPFTKCNHDLFYMITHHAFDQLFLWIQNQEISWKSIVWHILGMFYLAPGLHQTNNSHRM